VRVGEVHQRDLPQRALGQRQRLCSHQTCFVNFCTNYKIATENNN
jgi:hypothetical protein